MEKYQIAPAYDWVVSEDIDISRQLDSSSPYYYFLVDYQERVTEDRVYVYKRTIEQINDVSHIEDASLFLSELQDNNHQLIFHVVDVVRDGVRFSVLNNENISIIQREKSLENHITDNRETVSLSIDDLRVGDIIDYQATDITCAGDHPLNGKFYNSIFWLNWNCPVLIEKVRIINESRKSIQLQHCAYKDGKHGSTREYVKPKEIFAKEYENLSSMPFEDVTPSWLWPDFLMATTCAEWEELSSYLYKFYTSHGALEGNVSIADIDICDPGGTSEENIIDIVRYVQNEVRYKGENHGIYTHTPKSAEYTLTKRYGDCKDKSNLLVTLLEQINVKAYLMLVNTDYGIKIKGLNPSLYHFNHMIVHIEHDGKDYYFDPTIKKQAGDLEHSSTLDYGYGLDLTEKGVPLSKLQHDITRDVYKLKHIFDFSGKASDEKSLKIIRTYHVHRADNMRFYIESTANKKLAEDFHTFAKEELCVDLSIVKPITVSHDDKKLNILQTEEQYSISDSPEKNRDEQLHVPTNIYNEFPTTTNKDMPLRIDMDGRMTHDIEVIYKTDPLITVEKASINNKWFCYQDSILRKDNVLYLSATAVPKRRHVSSCDIDDYVSDVAVLRERSMNNFSRFSNDHSYISSLGGWMIISSAIVVVILIVSKLT
jgi:hypothetical protein